MVNSTCRSSRPKGSQACLAALHSSTLVVTLSLSLIRYTSWVCPGTPWPSTNACEKSLCLRRDLYPNTQSVRSSQTAALEVSGRLDASESMSIDPVTTARALFLAWTTETSEICAPTNLPIPFFLLMKPFLVGQKEVECARTAPAASGLSSPSDDPTPLHSSGFFLAASERMAPASSAYPVAKICSACPPSFWKKSRTRVFLLPPSTKDSWKLTPSSLARSLTSLDISSEPVSITERPLSTKSFTTPASFSPPRWVRSGARSTKES
mmetsp:Transcript_2981/g.8984  ORF Transcript_2981/g.8984 Transcript_2981/m.8984 type:complete len:266 (-) Transcript_2981:317-1114(-)